MQRLAAGERLLERGVSKGGFRYAPAQGMREAGALIHSPLASLAVVGRLACALDARIMPHAGH